MWRVAVMGIVLIGTVTPSQGAFVYQTDFAQPSNLDEFSVFITRTAAATIEAGQLKTTAGGPFNPDDPLSPLIGGEAYAMLDNLVSVSGLNPILRQNPGEVSWSMNLSAASASRDEARMILASSHLDPRDPAAQGYFLRVQDSSSLGILSLIRFRAGINSFSLDDRFFRTRVGLAGLPSRGTVRVSYDPAQELWRIFLSQGSTYQDPTLENTLLGSAVDGTYTGTPLGFNGLGGEGLREEHYFDNYRISVIPEPGSLGLLLTSLMAIFAGRKGRALGEHLLQH